LISCTGTLPIVQLRSSQQYKTMVLIFKLLCLYNLLLTHAPTVCQAFFDVVKLRGGRSAVSNRLCKRVTSVQGPQTTRSAQLKVSRDQQL
jgi:hypothetical protein